MRTILQRNKTERGLRTVYVIAFLLLILSYTISVFNNIQLKKQAARVDHTNTVIKLLDDMLARVKDAETGVRGYVIYRNISFLSPYFGSQHVADSNYRILLKLTADSPVQQGRLESLYMDIKTRFSSLQSMISLYNDNHREINDSLRSYQDAARETMNRIRIGISVMQLEEDRQLAERNERMNRTFGLVNVITLISILLAFSLLFFGFIAYREVSKARKQGTEEILLYEKRLKQRIEELDKANSELVRMRSQEKFAATGRIARTIAHEVRNPLTNINLASDQLRADLGDKEENMAYLFNMITRNSNRINQLISDLLNSTKIPELSFEKVRIGELLDEALADAADRVALSNTWIERNYRQDPFVLVDRSKMKIAFLNIIINGLEAMDKSERKVLSVETDIENSRCIITISDIGSGMDSEAITRIFEPYFTSKSKGNGLGLTNTQNIILNHEGEISVESQKGQGTRFIIILNIAKS